MIQSITLIALISLLTCTLSASIVNPKLKSIAKFHHIHGPNEEKVPEDLFLLKGTILSVTLEANTIKSEGKSKAIWYAFITTTELDSDDNEGSKNQSYSVIFESREVAIEFLNTLLSSEK